MEEVNIDLTTGVCNRGGNCIYLSRAFDHLSKENVRINPSEVKLFISKKYSSGADLPNKLHNHVAVVYGGRYFIELAGTNSAVVDLDNVSDFSYSGGQDSQFHIEFKKDGDMSTVLVNQKKSNSTVVFTKLVVSPENVLNDKLVPELEKGIREAHYVYFKVRDGFGKSRFLVRLGANDSSKSLATFLSAGESNSSLNVELKATVDKSTKPIKFTVSHAVQGDNEPSYQELQCLLDKIKEEFIIFEDLKDYIINMREDVISWFKEKNLVVQRRRQQRLS
jgi:hypothetical protein